MRRWLPRGSAVGDGDVGVHRHRGLDAAAGGARDGRLSGGAGPASRDRARGVRSAWGYEVDYEGDAFFYAFASAPGGGRRGQRGDGRRSTGGPIRIRVGIHTGEPGLDPPNTSGWTSTGPPESWRQATAARCSCRREAALSGEPVARDLGAHRLKDLLEPEPLYQLGAASFRRRGSGPAEPSGSCNAVHRPRSRTDCDRRAAQRQLRVC